MLTTSTSQPLHYGGFEWVDENYFNQQTFQGKTNCFEECDIEYLTNLHNLHNAYPLAPEKLVIKDEWLSYYCKDIKE